MGLCLSSIRLLFFNLDPLQNSAIVTSYPLAQSDTQRDNNLKRGGAIQAEKQTDGVTDWYRRTKVDDRLRKTIILTVRSLSYELRVHISS